MRRKNLLKELGIQKQADTSCNALDIDTENIRQRVYAKLDFADTERKLKSVSFDYQKNGDVVSFEQQKFNSELTPSGDIIATVNGTNLYYVHYM